jgi:hypothetical protein
MAKRSSMRTTTVTLRLPPSLSGWLRRTAARNGLSLSEMGEAILAAARLDRWKPKQTGRQAGRNERR